MGRMGSDPFGRMKENALFNESKPFDVTKERPRKQEIVRDNSVQAGLPSDWTRATFIVRVDQLDKLKDYAYTERLSLKEAMEKALDQFLEDKTDLLPHR